MKNKNKKKDGKITIQDYPKDRLECPYCNIKFLTYEQLLTHFEKAAHPQKYLRARFGIAKRKRQVQVLTDPDNLIRYRSRSIKTISTGFESSRRKH